MAWNVKGTYLETCSCEFFLPVQLLLRARRRLRPVPRHARLQHHRGRRGGNRRRRACCRACRRHAEGHDGEGNWRLGLFVDDKASDEQADKLAGVFSGALGGPMAGLAPLIGENLGVERAPIEVREDGLRHSVRIGDAVDFEIEDVVPFGIETGEPVRIVGMFHPAGSEFRVAEARRAKISAFGIEYTGKSALSASQFSWAA